MSNTRHPRGPAAARRPADLTLDPVRQVLLELDRPRRESRRRAKARKRAAWVIELREKARS